MVVGMIVPMVMMMIATASMPMIVIVVMIMVVMVMAMVVMMTCPAFHFCLAAAAYGTHQSTSNSLIRNSSPWVTCR